MQVAVELVTDCSFLYFGSGYTRLSPAWGLTGSRPGCWVQVTHRLPGRDPGASFGLCVLPHTQPGPSPALQPLTEMEGGRREGREKYKRMMKAPP